MQKNEAAICATDQSMCLIYIVWIAAENKYLEKKKISKLYLP